MAKTFPNLISTMKGIKEILEDETLSEHHEFVRHIAQVLSDFCSIDNNKDLEFNIFKSKNGEYVISYRGKTLKLFDFEDVLTSLVTVIKISLVYRGRSSEEVEQEYPNDFMEPEYERFLFLVKSSFEIDKRRREWNKRS